MDVNITLEKILENLQTELRQQSEINFNDESVENGSNHRTWLRDSNWNMLVSLCGTVFEKYPLGVTSTILLAEIEDGIKNRHKTGIRQTQEESVQRVSVKFMLETNQTRTDGILECKVKDTFYVPGTQTRIASLCDSGNGQSIEMYLHQTFYDREDLIKEHQLRITSLRLHKACRQTSLRLLPSQHLVAIVDIEADKELIATFKRICDVQLEERDSQQLHRLRVRILTIEPIESLCFRDGSSARRLKLSVVDVTGEIIQLYFWDDEVAFKHLFSVGDTLLLQNVIFSRGEENWFLEYCHETFIYLVLVPTHKELVSSQSLSQTNIVLRNEDGSLDYSIYPQRIFSVDIMSDMSQFSLCCIIESISSLKSTRNDATVQFDVIGSDDFGTVKVTVFSSSPKEYRYLDVGQAVVMEGLKSTGKQTAILNTDVKGRLWNVTLSRGLMSSASLLWMASFSDLKTHSQGNFFSFATIIKCNGRDNNGLVVKVHSTCASVIDMYWSSCDQCGIEDLEEELDPSKFTNTTWEWKFNLGATLCDRNGMTMDAILSEKASEYVTRCNASQFSKLSNEQKAQRLSDVTEQTFTLSVVVLDNKLRIETIATASENCVQFCNQVK